MANSTETTTYLYAIKRDDFGKVESVVRSPSDSTRVEVNIDGHWVLSPSNKRTSPRVGSPGQFLTVTDRGYVACTEQVAFEYLGIEGSEEESLVA